MAGDKHTRSGSESEHSVFRRETVLLLRDEGLRFVNVRLGCIKAKRRVNDSLLSYNNDNQVCQHVAASSRARLVS